MSAENLYDLFWDFILGACALGFLQLETLSAGVLAGLCSTATAGDLDSAVETRRVQNRAVDVTVTFELGETWPTQGASKKPYLRYIHALYTSTTVSGMSAAGGRTSQLLSEAD